MTNEIKQLEKALADAQRKSIKCAERRHALPPGSSRARVTTANANWARAAEHRDRCSDRLDAAKAKLASESAKPAEPALAIEVGGRLTLGHQTYTVAAVGKFIIRLCGSRGGRADLVQNLKNPTLWSLVKGVRSEWYRQDAAGFRAI